jgi:hypothetical protein
MDCGLKRLYRKEGDVFCVRDTNKQFNHFWHKSIYFLKNIKVEICLENDTKETQDPALKVEIYLGKDIERNTGPSS